MVNLTGVLLNCVSDWARGYRHSDGVVSITVASFVGSDLRFKNIPIGYYSDDLHNRFAALNVEKLFRRKRPKVPSLNHYRDFGWQKAAAFPNPFRLSQ